MRVKTFWIVTITIIAFGFTLSGCNIEPAIPYASSRIAKPPPIDEVFYFFDASPKIKSDFEKAYINLWARNKDLILTLYKNQLEYVPEVYEVENGTKAGQDDTVADDGGGEFSYTAILRLRSLYGH